ncbi:hypothetical protein [Martelella limonii]|uniref:hypothetical protein n=1 Tax=Martelella limonii TaxID=1647649 RepID=UPI001580206A|nr:hypothetical protein [Martelella limonii]
MGISDWISLLAAAVACGALLHSIRTSRRTANLERLQKKLAEVEIERQEKTSAEALKASFKVTFSSAEKRVIIENSGSNEARNVRLGIKGNWSPMASNVVRARFPVKKIEPGDVIKIPATWTMGAPPTVGL